MDVVQRLGHCLRAFCVFVILSVFTAVFLQQLQHFITNTRWLEDV